jgi:predicted ester cyclase
VEQTADDPKAIVNHRFEVLNSHRPEIVHEVIHPQLKSRRMGMQKPAQYIASVFGAARDGLKELVPSGDTIEDFRSAYSVLVNAFPDFRIDVIGPQVAVDDLVVSRVRWSGTHEGEFAGLAPTLRKVAFDEVLFMRVADGKVVDAWAIAEELLLLEQLGVLPDTEKKDTEK